MHIFALYIPQSVIAWMIIGLIAGWLAGTVSRGRGFGCIADIILGMVGAILGGWIFSKLNIRGGRAALQHRRSNSRSRHFGGNRQNILWRERLNLSAHGRLFRWQIRCNEAS